MFLRDLRNKKGAFREKCPEVIKVGLLGKIVLKGLKISILNGLKINIP